MTSLPASSEKWYNKTSIVIILLLFFFPVGIYALWKSSKIGKGWKIAGTAIILLLVIAVASEPNEKVVQAAAASAKSTTDQAAAASPTAESAPPSDPVPAPEDASAKTDATTDPSPATAYLFKTPDDFKNAFNNYCGSINLDFEIGDLEVKEGEVQNSFQYMFTDHLGILGTINKANGSLIEVTMLGTGDGTFKSGANIMILMMAIIATVDPDLKASKRSEVLKQLGLLGDGVDMANLSGKTNYNGIHYVVSSSKEMGLWFSASRV